MELSSWYVKFVEILLLNFEFQCWNFRSFLSKEIFKTPHFIRNQMFKERLALNVKRQKPYLFML